MGQKTNPIGNRLGFIHGWDSNWYGGSGTKSKDNAEKIVEDDKIRKYYDLSIKMSHKTLKEKNHQ